MKPEMRPSEQTGDKFNLKTYFQARTACIEVVGKISRNVVPGMNEADGQELIKSEFAKIGVTKFWHPSKFRVGIETLKTFRDVPDQNVKLKPYDMFFLDVGPVIDHHEADYGETFVLNPLDIKSEKYLELAKKAEIIWEETANEWKTNKLSGAELFKYAERLALSLECILNPMMAGHRLGDFPHALFSKDRLFEMDFAPAENLWVLEIHIRSPQLERGAFFEDILIS